MRNLRVANSDYPIQAHIMCWPNGGLMLEKRLQRYASNKHALIE